MANMSGFRVFYSVLYCTFVFCLAAAIELNTDEVFMIPFDYNYFNWSTPQSPGASYVYSASSEGLPDLPKWMQLTYNPSLKSGFLFGKPPANLDTMSVDLTAMNKHTFETAVSQMNININLKPAPARRQVKMKIHNLNIEDMMDGAKQSALFSIFQNTLWQEAADDLHLTELDSALTSGGRRPARYEDGEGVILMLGSRSDFSEVLRELEREVSPLWSFRLCPRDFKKTSVERYFRSKGFNVDWCSFRLSPENPALPLTSNRTPTEPSVPYTENPLVLIKSNKLPVEETGLWRAPATRELPQRNYTEDGIITIFVPLVVLLFLAASLTAILGVHPEGQEVEEGQLYEAVFEELPFLKPKSENIAKKENVNPANWLSVPSKETSSGTLKRNLKVNQAAGLQSINQDYSPFLKTSTSPSPTPASTLSRLARSPYSSLCPSDRTSTLGRPEPPRYLGSTNTN